MINISIWHLTLDISHMPLLSINMKTKVDQHVPGINIGIYGSQCLSDFQKFLLTSSASAPMPLKLEFIEPDPSLKNVWTSDKSWEPGALSLSHSLTPSLSHSLNHNMLNNFCFHFYAQKSLFPTPTLSISHSHTLPLSHSLTQHAEQLLFSCLCSKVTHSHSLNLSLSHWLTLSISHSLTLNMLNNFCFHVKGQTWTFNMGVSLNW